MTSSYRVLGQIFSNCFGELWDNEEAIRVKVRYREWKKWRRFRCVCEIERASEYVWRLNDGWWFIADNSMNAWGKPLIMQHLGCRSILSRVNGRDVQRTATLAHNVFFTSAHHISSRQTSRKCTLCSSHNVWKVLTVTALNTEQCGILD